MSAVRDLTQGSILRHTAAIASPAMVFLLFQALYFLVDLYFVAPLGEVAIAGASMGGNVLLITTSVFQTLGIGASALMSHALGRHDRGAAQLAFNQTIGLSMMAGAVVVVAGYGLARWYVRSLTTDAATIAAATTYLYCFLPGLALQFTIVPVTAALRAAGSARPMMVVYVLGILFTVTLAPILIHGWLTGRPLGIAGAGIATTLGSGLVALLLWGYFRRLDQQYVRVEWRQLRPTWPISGRMLNIGLPAGSEIALMFVHTALIYWTIRGFGPNVQAGFGLGWRVMQMLLVPAVAISFAAAPIAGQNFGAGSLSRVRQTFHTAAILTAALMLAATLLLQFYPSLLMVAFNKEAEVVAVGAAFLQLTSLGYVARGLIYASSSVFQGLGNTRPSLLSACASVAAFALPAVMLAGRPELRLEHVWYLWVAATTLQAAISITWLQAALRRGLVREGGTPQLAGHP